METFAATVGVFERLRSAQTLPCVRFRIYIRADLYARNAGDVASIIHRGPKCGSAPLCQHSMWMERVCSTAYRLWKNAALPAAFDYPNPGGPPSIVLVVSPLTAIMKDQASANSA